MLYLLQKHPHFLPNFKNPCWREEPFHNPKTELGAMISPKVEKNITAHINKGNLWQPRCIPYFYLAGFLKCGSREVFFNIRNHPMVPDSNRKGNHWWSLYRVSCEKHTPARGKILYLYS